MKKTYAFILSLVFTAFHISVSAQYCGGSGTSVCTPPGGLTTVGFYPSYDSLACAEIGTAYDATVSFLAPTTVNSPLGTLPLNYIIIDSIENLPCGLCWRTGDPNNRINGGGTGCVRITGTTFDAPGQYKLRLKVSANVTLFGNPQTLSNQDAEQLGVKYWIRVANLDNSCAAVDTLASGRTRTATGSITAPTISGATAICPGTPSTLSIGTAGYYAYEWSTGAITSSISINAAGTYSVTAYGACTSATASVNVTSNAPSPTITAGGPTTFCTGGSVTLDAGAGYSAYNWSNGQSTQQITVTTAGSYSCTVTQSGCQGASNTVTVSVTNPTATISANGPLTFCQGGSVTLTSSVADSYAWSTTESTQSITVNASGTYTVTATQSSCTATASVNVSVTNNTLSPEISPAGPVGICAGGIQQLDAGSGYDTYSWSSGGTTQTITTGTPGTFIVTVTQGACSGTDTVEVVQNNTPLTVNVSPAGPLTGCQGDNYTLDAGAGYDTYIWSTSATTQTINVTANGPYFVTVSSNGCLGYDTVEVTINNIPSPLITPAGTTTICAGSSATFDAGAGFDTYLWSNGTTTQTTTVSAATTLSVTVTDNGCTGSSSASATVNVTPLPTPAITSATSGNNLILTATPAAASAYEWLKQTTAGGAYTAESATTASHTVPCTSTPTYYTVVVTVNGCSDSSSAFTVLCSGVNDVFDLVNVSVMPNPAKDVLFVNYNVTEALNTEVFITDITGRRVADVSKGVMNAGAHRQQIDLSALTQGIYLLNLTSEKGRFNTKFVKE